MRTSRIVTDKTLVGCSVTISYNSCDGGLIFYCYLNTLCLQEDVFTITAIELGRLKKVKIRHDNKGGGAAWFLGHVEVTDNKSNET